MELALCLRFIYLVIRFVVFLILYELYLFLGINLGRKTCA